MIVAVNLLVFSILLGCTPSLKTDPTDFGKYRSIVDSRFYINQQDIDSISFHVVLIDSELMVDSLGSVTSIDTILLDTIAGHFSPITGFHFLRNLDTTNTDNAEDIPQIIQNLEEYINYYLFEQGRGLKLESFEDLIYSGDYHPENLRLNNRGDSTLVFFQCEEDSVFGEAVYIKGIKDKSKSKLGNIDTKTRYVYTVLNGKPLIAETETVVRIFPLQMIFNFTIEYRKIENIIFPSSIKKRLIFPSDDGSKGIRESNLMFRKISVL